MKWKYLFLVFVGVFAMTGVRAQLTSTERNQLKQDEDSLSKLGVEMINGRTSDHRHVANDRFIPAFVNALEVKNSFDYPFDSLKHISIIYNKDSSFRIFTWGLALSDIQYRFYGGLQMKTKDGNLQLFPFFDNSFYIKNKDTIADPKSWIGALYYNMVKTQYKDKTYYTLMGWCGYDFDTNIKVLDVLTFQDHKPVLGAPIFKLKNDPFYSPIQNRFFLKYKKNGGAGMNYDSDLNMIVFDHLSPLNGARNNPADLVPDGTYSGFKWINGYWVYIDKVFHGNNNNNGDVNTPPIPKPLKFNREIEGDKRR